MIVGHINDALEPAMPLRVRASDGRAVELSAVVDTGFNDWLTLSSQTISSLSLPFREEAHFTLADGSSSAARLFTVEVNWFGGWRRILVVEMDGGPLIGMSLLRGLRLNLEVIEGGAILLEPLNG